MSQSTRITITNGHWFSKDAAIEFGGYREWDGNNMICGHGNGQWGGCDLFFTRSGNWVLHRWYNGSGSYEQICEADAVQWLVNNNDHEPEGLPKKVTKRVADAVAALEV